MNKNNNNNNYYYTIIINITSFMIENDRFPLPNITDIYDMLGQAIYFSSIDLSQGYFQLKLDKKDRPITAFSPDTGYYQIKRLLMGL